MNIRRKKKHPKYRNKLTIQEKTNLSLVKDNVKMNKLKKDIYRLPFDIKCKIFQMAMLTHISMWVMNLKPWYDFVLQEYYDPRSGIGYKDKDNYHGYFNYANCPKSLRQINSWNSLNFQNLRKKSPCKNIHNKNQQGIVSVHIDPWKAVPQLIKYREYTNADNYFWTHYKCRCYECDLVRVTSEGGNIEWSSIETFAMGDINDKKYRGNYSNHKFRGITMDPDKVTQWSYKK